MTITLTSPQSNYSEIIDQIAAIRASSNFWFMQMWKLAFEVAPDRAAEIQRMIRDNDIKISELNKQLCE